MNLSKKQIKILIPILLIAGAFLIGQIVIKTTKKPEKKKPKQGVSMVETMPLKAGNQPVILRATGTVSPAVEITLRARVAGEIIGVAPEFIEGGSFEKGDLILAIDPTDYLLALKQKKAALAEAEFQLRLEKGQRDIAAREWELLGSGEEASEADRELALRVPHLKYRAAKLEAAKAELKKAELDLKRTEIRAPFNAVVIERKTNLGTQANPNDTLATLSGSDEFHVRVSIPVDSLQWIECDPKTGSVVTLTRGNGDVYPGRTIRLESALEETGRMARVLVSVKNPLEGDPPLLLNEYVHVEIEGPAIEKSFRIPRSALHDDRWVWLATPKSTLKIRKVNIGWRDATDVIVSGGLTDGERLILTNLSTPIAGMKLRIEGDPEQKPTGQGGGKSGKGQKRNEK